jgi:hypothetical protein
MRTASGDSVLLTIYGEVGDPPKVATIHIPMPIRETEELVASLQTAIYEASKNSHGA